MMPTVHYISRETLRKHGIDCLPWEVKKDVTPPNKKIKLGIQLMLGQFEQKIFFMLRVLLMQII
jgi:hypothetical protein